jgi:hypothetical protein
LSQRCAVGRSVGGTAGGREHPFVEERDQEQHRTQRHRVCGIHSGVASFDVDTSLNRRD